jgi:uncharacterized OB-fold protein
MADSEVLHAEHVLEYPYSRSVGPVIGAFLTGLRDGRLLGVVGSGGTVVVPPTEYDPVTGDDTGELVEVGPGGVVESWAWVARPLPKHPLQTPFAWALVRLDGADTAMLHVVDAGGPEALRTGDRVTVHFRPAAERVGSMADIHAFVPEGAGPAGGPAKKAAKGGAKKAAGPAKKAVGPAKRAGKSTAKSTTKRTAGGTAKKAAKRTAEGS